MREVELSVSSHPSEHLTEVFDSLPRDNRGRIWWAILGKDPERLHATIENLARLLIDEGINLTGPDLTKSGYGSIGLAIREYYPDEWVGLKTKLGIPVRRPRSYWTPQMTETEARKFLDEGGSLNTRELKSENQPLHWAINKRYPGGLRGLRGKLGIPEVNPQKDVQPRKTPGFWNDPTNVQSELITIISKIGHFPTAAELLIVGSSSLRRGISKTGGFNHWRAILGAEVQTKNWGYWGDKDNVRAELARVIQNLGHFPTDSELKKIGEFGLARGLRLTGGINVWRLEAGLKSPRREDDYWTNPETIERETQRALAKGIYISYSQLKGNGFSSLSSAIGRHYPGGIKALREKLGLDPSGQSPILPDQANKQLAKLLEGAK